MRVPVAAREEARAHAARLRTTVEGSRGGGPLWARIEDDVWREEVARALAEAADVVAVRIPASLSPDAALHTLTQAAAGLGVQLLGRSLDRSRPFSDRVAEAARWLADAGVCLVVSTASRFRARRGEPTPFMDELDAIYDVWSRARGLRSVWLAPTLPPPGFRGSEAPSFDGTRPVESWLEGAASTDVAGLARMLVREAGESTRCSPTAFSVALATLVAGRDPSRVARTLDVRPATMAAVGEAVGGRGDPLVAAVALARALRVPVPGSVLTHALGGGSEAAMLLDTMVWGDSDFFVPAALQRALPRPSGAGDPRVHDVLAEHHRSLDGAARPNDVLPSAVVHWLEKVHHLGHGGTASVANWESLDLPGPEFYWDRGRWLSIVRQDYAAAAEVYRRCRERFEDDAYSWHYEAFNFERAGLERAQAENSYHRAIRLEPGNVWFNRRLVTFYVGLGRFRAAEKAWTEALGRIEEDSRGPRLNWDWYAENFHSYIARAWLLAGEIQAARDVLDALPPEVLDDSPDLRRLDAEIADAEEAEELGESVYAPDVPRDRRWRRPQVLADADVDGAPLSDWSPGRVAEVGPDFVRVVFARRSDRVVLERTFAASEWHEVGWGTPRAGMFVELGSYTSGRVVVLPSPERGWHPGELQRSAYLDRWISS